MSTPITLTDATFPSMIEQHEGVAIVDVWASWCAPCVRLAPTIDALAAQYADRMVLLDGGRVVADGAPRDVLTEEAISRHYGATIDVVPVNGRVAVIPRRVRTDSSGDT